MNQTIKKRMEDINNGIVPEGYKQTSFGVFPCDWETQSLIGDVADCFDGVHETPNYTNSGIPFVSVENIHDLYKTDKYISKKDFEEKYKEHPQKGDVLMTRIGDVGTPALVSEDLPLAYYVSLSLLRPKNIESEFLYSAIQSSVTQKSIFEKTLHIAFPKKINLQDISKCRIVFPNEKREQAEIAKILMKWDEAVELQEQYIEKLELRKKAIIKKLLTPKDGWKKYSLKQVLIEKNERSIINNQYKVISSTKQGLFSQNEYFDKQVASENNMGYKIIHKGDIVLSPQNLWLGNINYNDFFEEGIVSPSYKIFEIKEKFNKRVVSTIMRSPVMLHKYILSSEQGASIVRRNLNMELFFEIDIYLPSVDIQNEIGRSVEIAEKQVSLQKEKLEKIKEQRKAMQQYLLTGIVRVT